MTVTFPEAVSSRGKKSVVFLTTAPADGAAITTTELGGGLNVSLYLQGAFAPNGTQNKGNEPRRTGEDSQLQKLGDKNFETPTLTYVHDPQGAPSDEANALKALLPEGTEFWAAEFAGIDGNVEPASGDQYRLHHLRAGYQWEQPSGDDEFAVEQVIQETEYLTPPTRGTVAA